MFLFESFKRRWHVDVTGVSGRMMCKIVFEKWGVKLEGLGGETGGKETTG